MKSPKDYLTDRLKEFDEKFTYGGVTGTICLLNQKALPIKEFLKETIQQSMEVGIEIAVNKLSGKPTCTEDSPCGCHMGEVFHADSTCNCDLVEELLKSLSPKL